ncbi:MAG TPA: sulfite exporter TauE/SafE family protein [Pseudolabrys sp.]
MTILHDLLAVVSGSIVGFVLGLVGGGGSILAVPLLVYVVGVPSPHVAIGTSAIAVAASAAANLTGHARAQTVKWPCAITFAIAGMIGAAGGAQLGKMVDGSRLLMLFGVLMVVVGILMLWPRKSSANPYVKLNRETMPRMLPMLIGIGLAVGALSGFFGIGGGFLIVPGLIGATAMPLINAIGSSLVSVTAFGLTTAASYAWSGLVDWRLAGLFVLGGALGGLLGIRLARHLAGRKHALTRTFSGIVIAVGLYVVIRSLTAS